MKNLKSNVLKLQSILATQIRKICVIALVAVIGFSLAACDFIGGDDDDNNNVNISLNGAWKQDSSGTITTIVDRDGFITQISGAWQSVKNAGNITIGSKFFRNITKTGNNTWSCETLIYNTSTFATSWTNSTITLSANGKTFTENIPSLNNLIVTYTKLDNNLLNGAWKQDSSGTITTIVDRDGFITQISGAWLSVKNAGYITIGDKFFRNITKTGNNTWSCETLVYNTSTFATSWTISTITLSANGKTFTENIPSLNNLIVTYTKVQ
ncbi:hypothetical protein R84B8_03168 [Treponema sp. R8-4-B8]